jgi:hypothetical protein
MPAWMAQALNSLRIAFAGTTTRALATGGGAGYTLADMGALSWIPDFFQGGGGAGNRVGRKRRKRLLTHQMKDDLAFIAATMGETTARKAALIAITH